VVKIAEAYKLIQVAHVCYIIQAILMEHELPVHDRLTKKRLKEIAAAVVALLDCVLHWLVVFRVRKNLIVQLFKEFSFPCFISVKINVPVLTRPAN